MMPNHISSSSIPALFVGLCLTGAAAAQDGRWQLHTALSDAFASNGIPVAAIEQPGWADHRAPASGNNHAWRAIRAEAGATHPSGWSFGALARSEAFLSVSGDAARLYAIDQAGESPAAGQTYAVRAELQGWRGRGVTVGTPWWPVAGNWRWSAQADALRLDRLRTGGLDGSIGYTASGAYDIAAEGHRSDARITGAFLGPSDPTGWGGTVSLAFEGKPTDDLHVRLEARDLFSRLHWGALATESAVADTRVTSRNPDGSLDYGPAISGRQRLETMDARIGTQWIARLAWQKPLLPGIDEGAWTIEASRKAGLNLVWLGWQSQLDFGDSAPADRRFRWRLVVEPHLGALGGEVRYAGWFVRLVSDSTNHYARLRQWQVGWTLAL